MTTRRSVFTGIVATALSVPLACLSLSALAQDRVPLARIVVGFPPGGATDTVARLLAEGMTGTYADSVIVENRPGAGGQLAANFIKDQPADGTWFLFTPAFPMSIHPHLYDLTYDTLTDFVPVATTHFGVLALSVGPMVPAEVDTLAAFIDWARANPDVASFGGPVGGSQHFAGVLFATAVGIELPLIGYPGGAPSVTDVLGGHIPAVITPLAEVLPHAQQGNLRVLAATSYDRSALAPEIPTFRELGFDSVVFQDWSGMLAPAGTPADLVQRANDAARAAVASSRMSSVMSDLAMQGQVETPAAFAEAVRVNWELYRDIIEQSGFELPN